jgi:hypothetical protein
MNRLKSIRLFVFIGIIFLLIADLHAYELESRYAIITYSSKKDLKTFNSALYMGGGKSRIRKTGVDTVSEDVIAKINYIVEKVMDVLEMRPPQLKFSITIHPGVKEVRNDFQRLYKVGTDYIAFYSPALNRVFCSAIDSSLKIVAHEIGHAIAENYFTVSPPRQIHEVMAQFAEQHVTD